MSRLTSGTGIYGSRSYQYDEVGNRLQEVDGATTYSYTYQSGSHRIATVANGATETYGYDLNGNTTQRGTPDATFVYGQDNRMKEAQAFSATVATYVHNAQGKRVKKDTASDVYYHYDLNGQLIAETDDTGATLKEYVYLNGSPLAVLEPGSGTGGSFPAVFDLATLNGSNGFRIEGAGPYDFSGSPASNAGDVNGDGIDDIIIGARDADPGGVTNAGAAYVVFGTNSGFGTTLNLTSLNGTNGFRIDGSGVGWGAGASVGSAGDVNGDGYDDIVLSQRYEVTSGVTTTGSAYVIFGKGTAFPATMDLTSLDGTNGFEMDVAQYYHLSVLAVDSAGDVNGDGYDDVIAGWASWGSFWSGESYIVFGKASGFPASIDLMNLNGTDGYQLEGIDSSDWSGYSVSRAGDVNGDGYDDVVLGAVQASPNSNLYAGESYVVFGKASGYTATFDLATLDGTNGFQLNGFDASDFSGFDVSGGGDINGDGFSDVIIGAYEADPNGDSEAGETYVVFGKASGFSAAIDLSTLNGSDGFRLDGIDALDESGRVVSHAGDVNDDGFDDLIIGAWAATVGSAQYAGESYVVFGKASGFPAVFDLGSINGTNGFRVDGIAAGDISGVEVSFAGDVNGDNTDDFLVGASGVTIASPWTVDAGETYVVFGVSGSSSDATYFVHTDHLGTPQAMTDAAQATAWKADYEPFGEATVTISTAELNLRFPGQYFDSETGAHYNYFRDYDAGIGRYLQSDPIGLTGGLNTYAYALNNPLRYIDPRGLKARVCCKGIGVFGIGAIVGANHCYIEVKNSSRTTWGLFGDTRGPRSKYGVVSRNDGFDNGGSCGEWVDDGCKTDTCVENAVKAYPNPSVYRFVRGPNSNTFAGTIARACGLSRPFGRPAPGWNDPPAAPYSPDATQ